VTLRGGCLCGLVEYEVDPPFIKFVKCHCSRCRKATGSAFAANAYVLPPAFRWLSRQDHVVRFDYPAARSFSTSFCRECGSPLPHATRSGREVIIPAGSLLDDPGVSPTIDCCRQSRRPGSPTPSICGPPIEAKRRAMPPATAHPLRHPAYPPETFGKVCPRGNG
jgi:hypothetical protein